MKKYLKLQAKKSLSLFLAVLMLMTCWVWVAPEKAEAASAAEGNYYVRVYGNLTDNICCSVTNDQWTVNWKTNNGMDGGTEGSTTLTTSYAISSATANDKTFAEGWVTGWPISLVTNHKSSSSKWFHDCAGRFENLRLQVRNEDTGVWVDLHDVQGWNFNEDGQSYPFYTKTELYPKASGIGTISDQSLTIPMIGTGSTASVSNLKPAIKDQYGVTMTTLSPTSYAVGDGSTGRYTKDDHGFWAEISSGKATVKVNELAQEKIACSKGNTTTTQYLYAAYSAGGVTIDETQVAAITLNYQKYETKIHPQGTLPDANTLSMELIDKSGNKTYTADSWTSYDVYGVELTNWPSGVATKTGYDFYGYWTVKQPSTGNSAITADSFAIPVSSDDFANVYGGTTGEGTYVTKDGVEYFNAGKAWDPSKGKSVFGKGEYYGWWASKNITVKFYDIDGTYMGTQTTKYGKTEAENWYPDPKDGYEAGAYEYQTFAKQWRDITGAVITEGSYEFGPIESLSLTPIYTYKTYTDKYLVNFVDPTNGTNIDGNDESNGIASGKYDYRHILSGSNIPSVTLPNILAYDNGYTYEFSGWSSQKPASGNYHIVAKDDTSFVENTDWVVRDDITYYAVFRSTVKEYLIAFQYTDSTGTTKNDIKVIPYGSAITTPANVNRTYAAGGYGYTLEGWDYVNNDSETVMLGVDASLVFKEENVFLTAENLATATTEKPIVFKANYDDGQPTPYTVTFKYKDAKGGDSYITAEVYHGTKITQETVDKLLVSAQYDDGEALYTFANKWIVTEGVADKAEYTKEEFTSFGPTSHVTFEAVYDDGVPYYTVKYMANNMVYTERILKGSNVPAWMIQTGTDEETGEPIKEEYVPEDYESETGTYKFAGWFDEEQTDKTYTQTNGTEYTTASIVEGDLTLYAQYEFEPFKFTIKFMDYTGKVQLAIAEVEIGQSFEAAFIEAQRAAQYRAPDETYTYTFIGWDYKVPDNYLCEGKDVTYTAQYRPSYIYYKANWYNSADAITGDPLATTNHTYNGAVYAPSVELTVPENASEGQSYVFAGWYYNDAEGNAVAYQRGMTITADMNFYATYTLVNNAVTVTTVVGDVTTEYKVEYGKKATAIGTPVDGYVDETYHNHFTGWETEDSTAFDIDTTEITANIKIIAQFETAEHTKNQKELISEPTYYEKGSEKVWCACSKEDTIETVEIPLLTDTVAPTGIIYLGTQGKWSSSDDANNGANDTNKYYANDDTDLILTINDTGDVNTAYNPSGAGKGIKMIRAFVSSDTFTADQAEAASKLAITIFSDDSQTLNNTANYTAKVGDFVIGEEGNTTKLVDGEEYIVYYYVIDKAGNVLNKNVRTAKFVYDATAPEFEIAGDSNAETAASTVTYCGKAVVKGIENDAVVTVNGEEVELATAGASGETAYTITEAGNYIIKVTDKAGNSTSKKIIVADGHTEVTTEKAADCEADGYKKVTCAICDKIISEEKYESDGHNYGETETIEATCDEGGYDIQVCSVCGDEVKSNETEKLGHNYDKDTEGNIIYTVVTKATCKTEGKKIANCTRCGKGTLTETIPVDANGHVYGGIKTLKATCTADGETYQNCKYCFVKNTVSVLPKLDHVNTGRYTKVTTEATCYSEGVETTYCKKCDTVVGTAPISMIAHTLKLVEYTDIDNFSDEDKATYPNGYMQYECQAEGCTHTEGKVAITPKATYTVTFKGADGAVVATITKTEGESIAADAVADQTKAKDQSYEYTFAGWKGSDGKVVKLPVVVTKNETYTAEFTSTKRIYTHKFMVPTKWTTTLAADSDGRIEFAEIMGTYGDTNKKPVAVPVFSDADTNTDAELKSIYTFKFLGWSTTGAVDGIVKDFTMYGDATFIAVFEAVSIEFSVLFYDEDRTTVIWNTPVDGGEDIAYGKKDAEGNLVTPEKADDADNHYAFAGWAYGEEILDLDDSFGPITETTRVYATYTGEAHNFVTVNDADKTWAATCTKEGQKTEKCSVCEYEKVTVLPMVDHSYETKEDGSQVCKVCGDTIAPEAKIVTITFNESVSHGTGLPTIAELKSYEVAEGDTKTYTAPAKVNTAEYEYKFKSWVDEEGNVVTTEAAITVTAGDADATYTAVYEATTRKYNVTYLDLNNNVLKTDSVEYGGEVPAAPASAPEKKATAEVHYVHTGWTVEAGAEVYGDIIIRPVYTGVEHDWDNVNSEATCTTTGGEKQVCKICKYELESPDVKPALGHDWSAPVRVEPTYDAPGSITKTCNRCGETDTTPLAQLTYKTLTVTVTKNSAIAVDAKVVLYINGTTVETNYTNNSGVVTFSGLANGTYTVQVIYGSDSKTVENVSVYSDTAITVELIEQSGGSQTPSCSCSCHKNGFWGIVFRFFHKIIKFFTGKISCCSNPDPRY